MEKQITYGFRLVLLFAICVATLCSCTPDENEKLIVTRKDSTSYSLGVAFAKKIPQNLQDNKIESVDFDYFIQGINDYFDSTTKVKLSEEDINRIVSAIFKKQINDELETYVKENEPNIEKGETYLTTNKKSNDIIEIKPGLQYKIVDLGWGRLSPLVTDTIFITFKVFTTSNRLVYSSDLTKIYLGSAIPALQQVLPHIKTGGNVRIFTSHEFAYGSTVYKQDLVKPYEALIFDVTLKKIKLNSERLAEYKRLVQLDSLKSNN
ncbi:MAG: FKBP-type peptidyl-prolyl cis-trans isomerase [Bacteroidales bacterium]|nr:FKBP-type peptidyl-prolyl cis-trans isomerase [Bacteroidales bacterium]